ncbi:MAG TPA: GTP cyclohydrolase FolE2 [Paracoccaceae bacterium]|nr:GTP cyclohydrolase FolE2 [Paracoccaceae bacterium]HMO72913.1 GTP cyclohydrolase FolE2 [Paracoccaceae bacterium]
MNMHMPEIDRTPSREEAEAALALLRRWAAQVTDAEVADAAPGALPLVGLPAYPDLSRAYPAAFRVDDAYRAGLPDLQNGPASLIVGAHVPIQHVGISNFRLPIRYRLRDGGETLIETSVTGTVGLEAEAKGINMSRIMRSFYAEAGHRHGFEVAEAALDGYLRDLGAFDARIQMRLSFPMQVTSLRSNLVGWQYYDVALELVDQAGMRKRMMHLDFVYSSTCPCSLELSEHARRTRGQLATPHSQRSVARLSVELRPGADLRIEDLVGIARAAVPTETQVMVKREDEQAFAELNAANPIFVEDAARSFCAALERDPRIGDFRVVASHQESLHSHDAVSLLTRGPTFAAESLDPRLFQSLVKAG